LRRSDRATGTSDIDISTSLEGKRKDPNYPKQLKGPKESKELKNKEIGLWLEIINKAILGQKIKMIYLLHIYDNNF
jgi:hypothetical protein